MEQATTRCVEQDERVLALRLRIDEWRESRTKRTRMPEDLWCAAASLVEDHGAWKISRALRVRYDGLKRRANESKSASGENGTKSEGFVKMGGATWLGGAERADAVVVEVSGTDGAKLTIRLAAGTALDIGALACAFGSRIR